MIRIPSRRSQRRIQTGLLVEMLEDRRVLSTLAFDVGVTVSEVSETGRAIAAQGQIVAQDLSDVYARSQNTHQEVAERLLDKLPEHVIAKHPLVQDVVQTPPSVPDPVAESPLIPGNSGNGNSGNGNSGNGNSNNGNNGNSGTGGNTGRLDVTPTVPRVGTPSGPDAGPVDRPGDTARPDEPEVATAFETDLTFTPDGADIVARNQADAAALPAGSNQPTASSPDAASADAGASTRLVQEATELGTRPTAEAEIVAEDESTAALLQELAYLEAAAAAPGSVELQGADLAAIIGGGIDLRALDEALRQAVANVERAGQAVAETVVRPGFTTWVAGAIGSLLAVEGLRRARRRRRARLAGAHADDSALTWVPGMPGSFSVEDA